MVILLNGEFPSHELPLSILKKSQYIICCDGAVNQLESFGLNPDVIIGDMDSINDFLKQKYSTKLVHIKRKTDTDFEKSLKYCIENNIDSVKVLGFSGERDDQYLSNIFLSFEYSRNLKIEMYSGFGSFNFVNEKQTFESFIGQKISLFSNYKETKIKTENLKYNLNREPLSSMYSGISNESVFNQFTVETDGSIVIVYQLFKD